MFSLFFPQKLKEAITKTRPSVNYAKDWLGQLFLIPGLEKGYISPMVMITMGQSTAISCVLRHFRHDDNQPTKQPGDPIASLLLTSVRRQSSSIKSYSKSLDKEKKIKYPLARCALDRPNTDNCHVSVCDYKNTSQGSPRWSSEEFARLPATSALPG